MNTKQLIVLWYAGVVVAGIQLDATFAGLGGLPDWLAVVVAVVILAGLLFYSFRPHPKASGKHVAIWVGIPLGSLGVLAGLIVLAVHLANRPVHVPLSRVEVFDARLDLDPYREPRSISFRIRNLSDKRLTWVSMRVLIVDRKGDQLDGADIHARVDVPPSETRSTSEYIYGLDALQEDGSWTVRVLDVLGER